MILGTPKNAPMRAPRMSEQTFYRWKAKFGGMDVADAKRLKGLEEENRKLKQLVGELSLDNQGLRFLLTKKF